MHAENEAQCLQGLHVRQIAQTLLFHIIIRILDASKYRSKRRFSFFRREGQMGCHNERIQSLCEDQVWSHVED